MRVLVTGATGRIGANTVKHLLEVGHEVRAVVRPDTDRGEKLHGMAVERVAVDLCDREGLSATVEGVDAIVHLGVKLRGPNNWDHLDVNIAPTLTLLEAVRTRNPGLKRFVYGSSDVLFPHTGYMPELITERDVFTRPVGMYAVSKLASEAIVHSYHRQYRIPTVTLNIPMTFCGRELMGERAPAFSPYLADQIREMERQSPSPARDHCLEVLKRHAADGKQLVVPLCPEGPAYKRHIGEVRDVARACARSLETEQGIGEAFIIMSEVLHYDEGVRHLAEVSGMGYAAVPFPRADFYEYDLTRTRDILGFQPAYDGPRMLEDAWRHQQGEEIGVIAVGPTTPV
jgi:nucleoside-diphosphate-sugar epimerase